MKTILSEDIHQIKSESGISYKDTHLIDTHNWGRYLDIAASCSIANDESKIYLRYQVTENNVNGLFLDIHDPVYKDSCVEFFISFDGEGYYNFEFNCIGTVLAGFGYDRINRQALPVENLETLEILPSLGRNKIQIINREIHWQLDVVIPLETFLYSRPENLKGVTAHCNFYKCGDDLPEPHYLSWSPVMSSTPNFHLPEFFGVIKFK